jgi:hypothetical protein
MTAPMTPAEVDRALADGVDGARRLPNCGNCPIAADCKSAGRTLEEEGK